MTLGAEVKIGKRHHHSILIQCLIVVMTLVVSMHTAWSLPSVILNEVFREDIKTVQCYPSGMPLDMPIYRLNTQIPLHFSFDLLGNTMENFSYTLIACDRNWKPVNVSTLEYLSGYSDAIIGDYQLSYNVKTPYVHYQLDFPNQDIQPTLSGNYALVVFSNNYQEPAITWRILVIEPRITIDAAVRIPKVGMDINTYQEITFTTNIKNAGVSNPQQEISATILQNNRWDNAISEIKPIFEMQNVLSFDWNNKIMFESGREFRQFDLRSLRFRGNGLQQIFPLSDGSEVDLFYDINLNTQKYRVQSDINGKFITEVIEYRNPSVEADYAKVNIGFMPEYPISEDVYVVGAFNDWRMDENSLLSYDKATKAYHGSQYLKQGYYNYAYVTKNPDNDKASFRYTEGNYYDTENDYLILVYFKPFGANFDRIIGYTKINSIINRF